MRLPSHILKAIEAELARQPSKIGQTLLNKYRLRLSIFEKNMEQDEPDYMQCLMDRIKDYADGLREWYYERLNQREAAKRKGDR